MFIVLVAEGDVSGVNSQEPGVGDGDSVSVSTQVLEESVRSDDGALGEDVPLGLVQRVDLLGPEEGICPNNGLAVELEFALGVEPLKTRQELAGEHGSDGMIAEEETGLLGSDPETFGSKSPSSDQAVEMGMVHEVLTPGVEEGGEADLGVELSEAKLQKSVGCRVKEQGVEELLVLKEERAKDRWNGEDPVVIANGKEIGVLLLKPDFALAVMTVGAMTIAATVGSPLKVGAGPTLDERPAELASMTAGETLEGGDDP